MLRKRMRVLPAALTSLVLMLGFAFAVAPDRFDPAAPGTAAAEVERDTAPLVQSDPALQKTLESLRITNPKNGSRVFVESGASGIPLTLTAHVNDALDTFRVRYTYGVEESGFSRVPPYPVTVPDLTALAVFTIEAAASSYSRYTATHGTEEFVASASSTFFVSAGQFDNDGNGLPDNIAALDLGPDDLYTNVVEIGGKKKVVVVHGLPDPAKALNVGDIDTIVSAADPDDDTRTVSATIPAALLQSGEQGLVILEVADDLATLVNAVPSDAVVATEPAGGRASGALYAELTILVTGDNGQNYTEIDNARLEMHPVGIVTSGVNTAAGENVTYFGFPTDAVLNPSTAITADPAGIWEQAEGGTLVEAGVVSARFRSLSILAPFNTPDALNIVSITNTGTSSLAGTSSAFASGGAPLVVRVSNATGLPLGIEVDGIDVSASAVQTTDGAIELLEFPAPEALPLDTPSSHHGVDIRVFDSTAGQPAAMDTVPDGLTYVAPRLRSVLPNEGSEFGNTRITVRGEGFAPGLTVTTGGSPTTLVSVFGSTYLTAVTSSGDPGLVDLTVTMSNNYSTTRPESFTYRPSPPRITSVFPDTVYQDGGYTVRVTGMNFLNPDSIFKGAVSAYDRTVEHRAFFTLSEDERVSLFDSPSPMVRYLDDTRLTVLTPHRFPGLSHLYVANAVYQTYAPSTKRLDNFFSPSNMVDFTFLPTSATPFRITNIVPDFGLKSGGELVTISGLGFPEETVEPEPETKGSTGFSGHTIRMTSQAAPSGELVGIELYYVRGDDLNDTDPAPSSLSFWFTYDPSVLTPVLVGNQPANQESANLTRFYGKAIDSAAPEEGVVSVVISGGTTGITTCDDVIVDPFDPEAHDPTDCENPFLLGRVLFTSVGADGATSTLALSRLSMADAGANPLLNVGTDDGFFTVGGAPCEDCVAEAAVDVFFGPNQAEAVDVVTKGATAAITVKAPPAFPDEDPLFSHPDLFLGVGFDVDVLVRDRNDPSRFAISKAESVLTPSPPVGNRGYIYLEDPPPGIGLFFPRGSWIFGGTVTRIEGNGFTNDKVVTVTIGGVEAPPAPGFPQTSTERHVIVPPLVTDSTDRFIYADLTVTVTSEGKAVGSDTAEGGFTYVQYDLLNETVGATTAPVASNAFFFDATTGGAFDLVFNIEDKQNTSTISTGGGSIEIPALPAEAVKNTSGLVFGILRAAKNSGVVGSENLEDTGDGIENVWKFDLHLFDGEYPWPELTGIRFNTGETPIKLSFPTDDTDLSEADVMTGGVSAWSIEGGVYDYQAGRPTYMPVDGTPQYESTITLPQAAIASGNVTELTEVKLYQATQAAFAVLRNAYPPASAINCAIADGSPTRGPSTGGTNIELSGDNIAWTNRVLFVPATKQGEAASVPANRGMDPHLLEVTTPTSPTGGQVTTNLFLGITTNTAGKGGTTTLIPVQGQFQFTTGDIVFPFGALLSALLALLGLLAGGDSGGGGGGPCFIATAAYGTTMVEQVDTLRTVRDTVLLDNAFGTAFVDVYYRVSPAVADVVAQSPALAAGVRMVLVPVIALAKLVLAVPHVSLGLLSLAFLAMVMRRRFAKRRKA